MSVNKVFNKKPKGCLTPYMYFTREIIEVERTENPGIKINLSELSKKCGLLWKEITPEKKSKYENLSSLDKIRHDKEMETLMPSTTGTIKRKKYKDPNAPKRPLSAYIFFCQEKRENVKLENPTLSLIETSKLLGMMWNTCHDKSSYVALAADDRARYESEMIDYVKTVPTLTPATHKKAKLTTKIFTPTSTKIVAKKDANNNFVVEVNNIEDEEGYAIDNYDVDEAF